jgi:hypothetical protein
VVELNRLTSFAEGSFATDDVVFAGAPAEDIEPIEVGAAPSSGTARSSKVTQSSPAAV